MTTFKARFLHLRLELFLHLWLKEFLQLRVIFTNEADVFTFAVDFFTFVVDFYVMNFFYNCGCNKGVVEFEISNEIFLTSSRQALMSKV